METQVKSGIDFVVFPVSERLEPMIDDLMAIYTGMRFGYFEFLADCGPATAADLAAVVGGTEMAMSEWLERQVNTGVLENTGSVYPELERRYRLPAARAAILVDTEDPLAA